MRVTGRGFEVLIELHVHSRVRNSLDSVNLYSTCEQYQEQTLRALQTVCSSPHFDASSHFSSHPSHRAVKQGALAVPASGSCVFVQMRLIVLLLAVTTTALRLVPPWTLRSRDDLPSGDLEQLGPVLVRSLMAYVNTAALR